MVEHGRHEDAQDDRHRPAKTRREQQREQLGLVADFAEGDDASGDEKGFHPVILGNPICRPAVAAAAALSNASALRPRRSSP
jgi:hypothetical protein